MDAQTLINAALRSIGVLAEGESPSTAASNDSFDALNAMLDSWSAEGLPIPYLSRQTVAMTGAASYALATRPIKIKSAAIVSTSTVNLPLRLASADEWAAARDKGFSGDVADMIFISEGYPLATVYIAPQPAAGTIELISQKVIGRDLASAGPGLLTVRESFALSGAASYTIGAGGTWASERPARLLAASIQRGSSIARPVQMIPAEEWAAYPKRGAGGDFADVLFYDAAYPTANIYLGPKPAAGTLELWCYLALAQLAGLATVISLPPGYLRALHLNLGIEMAPEFGVTVSAELAATAAAAKAAITGLNQATLGPAAPPPPPAVVPVAAASDQAPTQ